MPPRAAIADLVPYEAGRAAADVRREVGLERVVKLASNEGPFGPLPAAREALAAAAAGLNRYPERGAELRERLAERHGVAPERIALGNGADAIVGHLSLAFLEPGDRVAAPWPSFISYELDARKLGAGCDRVPLAGGAADLDGLLAAIGPRTRIVYVCNPNNPTGGRVGRAELARFVDAVPDDVLVVVDEAYHEYVDAANHPDAASEHSAVRPNVVALRTFSKIYGLAGLRIGYAVAAPPITRAIAQVRKPFDVNELAHVAALASLAAAEELDRRRAHNRAGRAIVLAAMRAAGLDPWSPTANFVAAEVGDGRGLAGRLERLGVIVRPLAAFGAPGAVRVTVGAPGENEAFARALAAVAPATSPA
jgi:histidinol-phosphate aminotransferase